jgi:6-phosphogluconate dehydrogenase
MNKVVIREGDIGVVNIGLIGLAVMGANLARNFASRGYSVAIYNRTAQVTTDLIADFPDTFNPAFTLEELVAKLERPRKLIIMVKAGAPVDAVISELLTLLEPGDIIMDGGNSHYLDSKRRQAECLTKDVLFLGVGISGGEEGALKGPSIMPGGDKGAWEKTKELLENIAAKVGSEPCVSYVGPEGAGHFVKMVHNGIEYADMQLIAEAYDLLRRVGNLTPPEVSDVFSGWNKGVLNSFLIEITGKIFKKKDNVGDGYLIDKIRDEAQQKGTGKWTVESALELGVPIPTITAAVDARALSSFKDKRVMLSEEFKELKKTPTANLSKEDLIKTVHNALYSAKIIAYAQGMELISEASRVWSWHLNLAEIVALWRQGCIIRAQFLEELSRAYANHTLKADGKDNNLLTIPEMKSALKENIKDLRSSISLAAELAIPAPAFSSALSYFDSYTEKNLPQNLTQAQRDFFGAHTYKRLDKSGDFHTEWES